MTHSRTRGSGGSPWSCLQQAHQHPTLMILATEEHSKHLNVGMVRAWPKPIHRPIQCQMAKARQQIVVTFSAEGSGGQPFGSSDDRLDAHLGVPIGFSRWLSKTAVGLREVLGDQQQIVDHLFGEDHRLRSFTHRDCTANLARS